MYLKSFREYLGLSQKEMAEKLDLTQVTIARYETNKMSPTSTVIQKYIDIFQANPNFLYLGQEPKQLTFEDNNTSESNNEILKDLNLLLTQNELNSVLTNVLIENVLEKFTNNDEKVSSFSKLLKSFKLEGHIPVRPFLFLYYIFRYIAENQDDIKTINNYKEYLIKLVNGYKTFSINNNAAFTSKIKQEFEANIELNLSEKECQIMITHPEETLKKLESKMSSNIILAHRKVNVNKLFL